MFLTSFFFLFSFLLCLISFLLIHKEDISYSFIRSLVVCYIIELCIGATLALPLSLLSIPINITSMGCIYLFVSFIVFLYILYTKKVQSYYFDFYDIITALFLIIFVLIVIWRVFSFKLSLNYYNSDPGVHFSYAMEIVHSGKLGRMYFTPLYNALFIELLEPIFSGINCYKSFIIADSFSNYMAGMIFYVLIASHCKSTKIRKLTPLFTILYFAGWPLYNYVLGGFVYWGVGVTLIALGIYLLSLYQQKIRHRKFILLLLLLTFYCIAMCYMLFIPYVAVLYVLTLIVLSWDKIKKINTKLLLTGCISILLLCAGVFFFAFMNYFQGNIHYMFSALSTEGGIHKSLYRDFIFFIPFVFYLGSKVIVSRKFHLNFFLLITYFIMICMSLILCLLGIMSPYYYYKLYYLMWLLLWLITIDSISYILNESHAWFNGYVFILAFMFMYTFSPIEDIVINTGLMEYAYSEFPIYSANGSYIKSPAETRYGESFWELISYVTAQDSSIPLVGTPYDYIYLYWYEPITGYNCEYIETTTLFQQNFINEKYSKASAFAILKSSDYYSDELNSYPILFENAFAVVYSTLN